LTELIKQCFGNLGFYEGGATKTGLGHEANQGKSSRADILLTRFQLALPFSTAGAGSVVAVAGTLVLVLQCGIGTGGKHNQITATLV